MNYNNTKNVSCNTQIPGGTTSAIAQTTTTAINERFCGRILGTANAVTEANQANTVSVCSKYTEVAFLKHLNAMQKYIFST